MSQNNFRKEPTFGKPSASHSVEKTVEKAGTDAAKSVSGLSVSLHSNKAPNYTFTPIMKRAVDASTPLKSIEESQMATNTETPKSTETATDNETPKAETQKTAGAGATASSSAAENTANEVKVEAAAEKKPVLNADSGERVIPAAAMKTEAAGAMSKYRRLGLVAVLAAVLGGIFFWLKPDAPQTVEELQSRQGGSLPIEFRPVDEEEAKRVEAQAKAEQEALARQQAEQAQQAAQQAQQQAQQNAAAPSEQAPTAPVAGEQQPPVAAQSPTPPVQADASAPMEPNAAMMPDAQAADPNATAEVRPEEQVVPAKPTPPTEKKTVKKAETKSKVKAITADEYNAKKAKNARMDQLVKNVETNKSSASQKTLAKASAAGGSDDNGIVSVKSMSVPKSTSLMQVFRDNKLNISDVNAMNKTNNMVSRLKAGERVTVRLDKNNRVVEMSVGSGGKFIRRADGSYSFSK